jgi:lysylphosphatidylglycerol synthetase-like protein (DUF2156 family)
MSRRSRIYPLVCRLFAVAFAAVLVALGGAPEWLATSLTRLCRALGLSTGEITIGPADLDYVLALSLMACIVVLAFNSATRPDHRGPFLALMVAKITSTIGFVVLAIGQGSVWVLPALADGIVAVGLLGARQFDRAREEPEAGDRGR